ncbi:MAG: hypothetical protein GY797_10575 [Deltaproteobacteria bacterium]|nr:hypothetical protein [Deltaproteobacteria bacterium]
MQFKADAITDCRSGVPLKDKLGCFIATRKRGIKMGFPTKEQWENQGGCGCGCRTYYTCRRLYYNQQQLYRDIDEQRNPNKAIQAERPSEASAKPKP